MPGLVLLAALYAFGSASATSNPSAPSIEDYLRETEVRSVSMSPDGKKLTLVKRISEDTYRLFILDLENNNALISAHNEPAGQNIVAVRWLTNERMSITLSARKNLYGFNYGYRRMMVMSPDGSNPQGMFSDRPDLENNLDLAGVFSVLSKDPDHILMSAHDQGVGLFKVNINTGTSQKIAQGTDRTIWFSVNEEGKAKLRFDLYYRSKKLVMLTYEEDRDKWVKMKTFRLKDIAEEVEKYLAKIEGDTTVLMLDRLDGDEYAKLHRYDLKTKEYTEVAFEMEGYDLWDTLINTNTDEVMGVSYITDRPQYHFFDEDYQRVQTYLETKLQNGIVLIKFISADKRRFLVFYSEPWRRGVYLVYDDELKKLTRIADVAPQIQKASTTSVDTIRYKALDETMIEAYLTFPAGRKDEKLPLIVYPHGGPHVRDWLSYDVFAQYWATRGYAVFQPNYRGSIGRGRSFEDLGNKEYGGEMINDIASGVRALVRAGRVDENRICAAGISYGGYASMMLSIKTDLLSCAVSINGPVDYGMQIKQDIKDTKDKEEKKEIRSWYDETTGNIDTEKELLKSHSPLQRVFEIEVPFLLIHAKDDGNVDFKNAKKMDKAIRRSKKKNYEFYQLESGGHSLTWGGATKKVLKKTEAFFFEHIGGDDIVPLPKDEDDEKTK